ncbi:rhomboid family intramembrane serine protease [bacterium]|nr:rhomboid family intramembrane serine protease [bacterium]
MYNYRRMDWGLSGGILTPGVKNLLVANGAVYLISLVFGPKFVYFFGLVPKLALSHFYIWQFATYMFLHGGLLHLIINMYALWLFGTEVERMWGTKVFYKYYFITGIGAGIIHSLILPNSLIPTIGASGAIMGILTAYAVLFPNRELTLLLFFILPIRIRAKTLALLFAAFSLLSGAMGSRDGIAHFAHLGGMLVGYVYMKRYSTITLLVDKVKEWKRKRNMHVYADKQEELEKLRRLVDKILDKANEVGMENLTKEEKRFLKHASKILNKERK